MDHLADSKERKKQLEDFPVEEQLEALYGLLMINSADDLEGQIKCKDNSFLLLELSVLLSLTS